MAAASSPPLLPATPLTLPPASGGMIPRQPAAASGVGALTQPTFEVTGVDVRPQVASRVEARVPSAAHRPEDEVLVLRVLVSAAGHAADVRLLRGSRTDPAADRAAVAAVRQWRFTPARKRGESVDCWLNVGVPVRAAS